MLEHVSLHGCASLLCCGILAYGAAHDVIGRTIPNWVPGAILVFGILASAAGHTLVFSLLAAAAIFVIGFVAFHYALLGGGDVKLLAATSLLVPLWLVPTLLEAIVIVGGVLALIYLSASAFVPTPAPLRPAATWRRAMRVEMWRIHRRGPLPYGVAIVAGTFILLARH